MAQAVAQVNESSSRAGVRVAVTVWILTAVFYFYQYAMRSAPAVMMPELSEAFGISAVGVASIVGLFYYGYSPFSLVAGTSMDRFGAKRVIPIGAAVVG
ncbi:MAG TPA: MFS transporter, partial [Pyrinomonadaceae bacterium]|nr:MFS transporter [Pyrinomonadaceae bacterium]